MQIDRSHLVTDRPTPAKQAAQRRRTATGFNQLQRNFDRCAAQINQAWLPPSNRAHSTRSPEGPSGEQICARPNRIHRPINIDRSKSWEQKQRTGRRKAKAGRRVTVDRPLCPATACAREAVSLVFLPQIGSNNAANGVHYYFRSTILSGAVTTYYYKCSTSISVAHTNLHF
jgi:hypothetical protein